MALGFGQAAAMQKSIETNRGQIRTRKFLNTDSKDLKLDENELKFNQFTKEEAQKFKEKRILDKKREKRNKLIIYGVFALMFIVFIYVFNF